MKTSFRCTAAFSLVEVTLALGIAAFALVSVFGLLPIGISSDQTATQLTSVANVLTAITSDLRATLPASTAVPQPTSPIMGIQFPTAGSTAISTFYLDDTGAPSRTLAAASRYAVVATIVAPAAGNKSATLATLAIYWPAAVSTSTQNPSLTTVVALDRN